MQESIDSALNTISSKLQKFSAKVGRLGLELFSGGLLGTIAGKQITDQFKEFEDRILFLRTKLTASARDFSILEMRIRELGRSTSFTAIEVAEGATVLAQAGLDAKEAAAALQSTLDLARGAQIELGQAGAILVNTMRSFGMETTRANEVASQFIAAARLGTLDVLDLKESIKEVLGTVRTLNIDLPTTLALLTQMAERSLKGTKAGTSLNTALLNLASKSKALKENLGIALPDNINDQSFIQFLETLYNRISRLGNLQRVSILQQLFNIRGGRAITALDDIGKIVRLQKEIRTAGDEARKAAVTMDSGFGGSLRRATSAAESLGITLGKIFTKALKPIVDAVPSIANGFERLAINNEMLVISLAALPPLMLGLGAGLLTLSFVGAKAAGILGAMAVGFRALTGAGIAALNAQLITLTQSMSVFFGRVQRQGKGSSITKKGGLFQQFDELLSATFLSPQKVGGRGRNAGKTRPTSFFGRVGNAQLSFTKIPAALSAIGKAGKSVGSSALRPLLSILPKLTAAFSLVGKVARPVITAFSQIGQIIKSTIINIQALRNVLIGANGIVILRSSFLIIFNGLKQIDSVIQGLVSGGIGSLGRGLGNGVGTVIKTLLGLITKGFRNLPRLLDSSITGLFRFFKAAGGFAAGVFRIANGVRRFVFSLSGLLTIVELLILFGPKIGFIRDAFARLGKGFSNAFQTIKGTITDLGPVFGLFSSAFGNVIGGEGALGIQGLIKGFRELANIVRSNLKLAFLQVVEAVAPLYDFLRNITLSLLEVFNLIGGIVGTTFGNIGAGIQGVTGGGAGGALSGIADSIKQAFSRENLKAAFTFVGAFFVEIARSINNVLRDIFLVINNLATFIQNTLFGLFNFIANSSTNAATQLGNEGFSGLLKTVLAEIGIGSRGLADSLFGDAAANKEAADKITLGFENGSKRLDNIFTAFADRLEALFSGNTEEQSKAGQENARKEREAAQERANREAAFQRRSGQIGNTPLTAFGNQLGYFVTRGIGEAASRGAGALGGLFGTRAPFNFQALGQFGVDSVKKGLEALQTDPTGRSQERIRKAKIKELQLDQKASISNNKRRSADNQRKLLGLFGKPTVSEFVTGLVELEKSIGAGDRSAFNARADRAERIRELRKRVRTQSFDTETLRDIVSATVGTFQQTRGNLLKVAGGKSVDQQQLEALNTIATNTGGPSDNLFNVTSALSKRAQPFVFQ